MSTPVDYPRPTPQMVAEAREAAERFAEEQGVGIEEVCVVGSPDGIVDVIILSDQGNESQ